MTFFRLDVNEAINLANGVFSISVIQIGDRIANQVKVGAFEKFVPSTFNLTLLQTRGG
jgi:hypothetical protein